MGLRLPLQGFLYGNILEDLTRFTTALLPQERIQFENDMQLLRLLDVLRERQALVYQITAQTIPTFKANMEIFRSIPGIGDETAAAILAEVVDVNYFPTPDKLSKWAGLVAKVNQSGHKKHITGKLFKRGNKYLRRALCLAVDHIYARQDPTNPLLVFVKNIYDRTGTYWLAICAGARKLLEIMWHLLKKQERWDSGVNTKDMVDHLTAMVKQMQMVFERRSRRLAKLLVRLQNEGEEVIAEALATEKRLPGLIIKAYLQTV
jgi:transposase